MLREAIAATELVRGDMRTAVSARFAAANLRILRLLTWAFAIHWLVVFFVTLDEGEPELARWGAALLTLGLVFVGRRLRRGTLGTLDERATVVLVVGLLLGQQLLMAVYAFRVPALVPALIVPPLFALLFQLVASTRIALHASWFGLDLLIALLAIAFGSNSEALEVLPGFLSSHLVALAIGAWRSRGYRRRIEAAWNAAAEMYEDPTRPPARHPRRGRAGAPCRGR